MRRVAVSHGGSLEQMRELPLPEMAAMPASGLPRRIVGRVLVHRVGWPDTGDQDDHGLIARHRKVRLLGGFGVNRTGRQRLQLLLVELRAEAEVPGSLQ